MRIAILGAGMLGTCLALELAQRGFKVDLFDREEFCLTQAGARNEGKLHLGFVYGADPTFKTARKMVSGALQFYPLLRRWLGEAVDGIGISTPFIYLLERGSILSEQECDAHFFALDPLVAEKMGADYPGGLSPKVKKLSSYETAAHFSKEKVTAAYQTPERSIDARTIARLLRQKVAESQRITFHPKSEITRVSIDGAGVAVEYNHMVKRFDQVVNCLWEGRLAIDQHVGLFENAPWSYRLKHAIFFRAPYFSNIPSVTIIQGPYGDLVNLGGGDYYLSWYPVCLRGFVKNQIEPPKWNRNLSLKEAEELAQAALCHLSEYVPSLTQIDSKNRSQLSVLGGFICAYGETDVHDPKSGLHDRHLLKMESKGGYHSINPGKYALCPAFAMEAADQIFQNALASPLTL